MAKPFKETPILYGKDAIRFEREVQRVNAMTAEERAANREKLRREYEAACKDLNISFMN